MMHFSPVSDSPLFPKIFRFSSAKISDDLFLTQNIEFRPLSRENYHFPSTSSNFSPDLIKFTCFLHTLLVFLPPLSSTMMHFCITQCTYWTPHARTQRVKVKTDNRMLLLCKPV